jgi:hypothetical protein
VPPHLAIVGAPSSSQEALASGPSHLHSMGPRALEI